MFFYQNQKCPVCQKDFSEQDDIVSCPECGAPHHRECWKEECHCHYADKHGTPEQWTKKIEEPEKEPENTSVKTCPQCGIEVPPFLNQCPSCGFSLRPDSTDEDPGNSSNIPHINVQEFSPFKIIQIDNYGGIPKSETINENEVEDIAAVVGQNTSYYLPKFNKIDKNNSPIQWNWASFFFAPYWLIFRKNYLVGCLALLFEFVQTFFVTYIEKIKLSYIFSPDSSLEAISSGIQAIFETNSPHVKYLYFILLLNLISFIIHILVGAFGNYIYLHSCTHRIEQQKELFPDCYKSKLRQVGGIAFGLACLSYFIIYFSPTIIQLILTAL